MSNLKDDLSDRKQYVYVNGISSGYESSNVGVPRGSVLGPLSFLIYIDNVCKSTTMFDVFMYADDTTLMYDLNDIPLENESTVLNLEFEKVSNWLACNELSLNTDKTKCMTFRKKIQVTFLHMNGSIIDILIFLD